MELQGKWIKSSKPVGDVCAVFKKTWTIDKKVKHADLYLTALGVYEVQLNGERVSDYVLAPGWTDYQKRLQYQKYDITEMLKTDNDMTVTVGKGWFSSPIPSWMEPKMKARRTGQPNGILGEIHILYEDGKSEILITDISWLCGESPVRFSEIYDGETYDAGFQTTDWSEAQEFEWPKEILIPQEGPWIREQEKVAAKAIIHTLSGETLVDFGQEVTGYVEFTVNAEAGDEVRILHGEVLDKNGNFYNENYRGAKAEIKYICRDGIQTWHPVLTFFGFRYVKLVEFPGEAKPEQFTAIAVHSDMKQTGFLRCGNQKINQLFSNILWGQRGNFLDVPTDCPQRDERLGWTGDAQVFVKAASYNYDVEKFFRKWLRDMSADQREDGSIGRVIPDCLPDEPTSAAWGDAAVICPWQIYLTYGNLEVLQEQFGCMKKWVDYITAHTKAQYLWTGGTHFGDWLGLDAPTGSYKGASREDFIASAYYAYSTELLVKAGHVLKIDVSEYELLYRNIVSAFRKEFSECRTQTEHILAIRFRLYNDLQKTADSLAEMIKDDGYRMRTGFVGTPYFLHVLSDYGYADLAYTLLLREEYPSWLYSVNKGATTIWEHWDGIMENGDFWSADMNSFNHYAYGAVADWIYEKAAGIQTIEENPGFERVFIAPVPDERLGWLEAQIDTRHGKIESKWIYADDAIRYEIYVEMPAVILIDGLKTEVEPGKYIFWGKQDYSDVGIRR